MADYKAFSPTAWRAFQDKCAALFPFLKKTWQGTRDDWNLLSEAEQAHYDIVNFTDDTADGGAVVVDEVTAGNLNPVTSNAVYNALGNQVTVSIRDASVFTSATWAITDVCDYLTAHPEVFALGGMHKVIISGAYHNMGWLEYCGVGNEGVSVGYASGIIVSTYLSKAYLLKMASGTWTASEL